MDIIKEKQINTKPNKIIIILFSIIAIIVFVFIAFGSKEINKDDVRLGYVKKGVFRTKIKGYGQLKSNEFQVMTSFESGVVKEISLKPGDKVSQGSPVIKIDNPILTRRVEALGLELKKTRAEYRKIKSEQRRQILQHKEKLQDARADYKSAKLEADAETELASLGVVSELKFKRAILKKDRLKEKVYLFEKQIEELELIHIEEIAIQQEKINLKNIEFINGVQSEKNLVVLSEIDGVVQGIKVELGQGVESGMMLGEISSANDLSAVIKIPQNEAHKVKVGQKSLIKFKDDMIEGNVSRVDPIVTNNAVSIEIDLPNKLPLEARPNLSVDAEIIVNENKNTYYMFAPGIRQVEHLYKLNEGGEVAVMTSIDIGEISDGNIQILSDVKEGDVFILTYLTGEEKRTIRIK